VPVRGTDGVYVIYTSGTTGLPKGVVREAGGHAVGLETSVRQMFGIQGPGDVVSRPIWGSLFSFSLSFFFFFFLFGHWGNIGENLQLISFFSSFAARLL
jgi:acyl-coenzyme A synthetase/AMP-(fatty) acid ligase